MIASARRLLDFLERIFLAASAICVVAIGVFTVWGVISRYFFNIGVAWSIEISEYLLVFVAFLAAAIVQRHRRHVRAGLIFDRLSSRGKRIAEVIISVVVFVAAVLLLWFGIRATYDDYRRGVVIYNILLVERWIFYLPVTIGMLVLTLRLLFDVTDAMAAVRQGGNARQDVGHGSS